MNKEARVIHLAYHSMQYSGLSMMKASMTWGVSPLAHEWGGAMISTVDSADLAQPMDFGFAAIGFAPM